MKKIPVYMIFLWGLISCQKNNPNNSTNTTCTEPSAYFKYKFDGTLIEMNGSLSQNSGEGSYIRRVKEFRSGACNPYYSPNCTSYMYTIEATKWNLLDDEGNPIFKMSISSPTLTQGQSYSNIQAVSYYPYFTSGSNPASGGNFSLTVIKIQNGYADGTFLGILSRGGTSTTYSITEGEFRNVKILQ